MTEEVKKRIVDSINYGIEGCYHYMYKESDIKTDFPVEGNFGCYIVKIREEDNYPLINLGEFFNGKFFYAKFSSREDWDGCGIYKQSINMVEYPYEIDAYVPFVDDKFKYSYGKVCCKNWRIKDGENGKKR